MNLDPIKTEHPYPMYAIKSQPHPIKAWIFIGKMLDLQHQHNRCTTTSHIRVGPSVTGAQQPLT
jgi:hypothetical protein